MNLHDKKLLAPVLDRLLDSGARTNGSQPHQVLRQLRESVRRDLEILFNTRYRCISPPAGCKELSSSLLNFGLADLATINLSSVEHRKRFCSDIESTILKYEPRIKSVKVTSDQKLDAENPCITFRVEAVLHTNPAPELIIFDSALDLITQSVDVSEIQ
ncbi:type VI secretion system baseplate subunit TssE [Simiduia sp. 21SJ11W-1]|uniref:type VI secretion system baseplate subunit TssE n=1 Tax=Simiduia sp. 21SJ11W-1 TaxID=2909669 RepID=UPI00209C98DD|nr:type VI secretion system baseplate subunit TssE [Simiduia sp. 21SJ11W-1]UTA46624.1 type VI secretion system baseplate subunit TssE [Simiduia sp. 21SJ11W-1]